MSILSNPRHERFAQELAKGKTADEAYVLAGYKQNDGNATRLKGKERILVRLGELQDRAASRVLVTVESLIGEAEEIRVLAKSDGQYTAALAAVREKGVLSGKRIERSEHGQPGEFERMSDEELEAFVTESAAEIRKDLH